MTIEGLPVATGGIYNHVGLLNREPKFNIYKHWLALVYTVPAFRNKVYGVSLCQFMEKYAAEINITHIHLFTHTAESLYKRIGWQEIERLELAGKYIVVMEKYL
jgi:GNAT superfamily N-acetyltransferase